MIPCEFCSQLSLSWPAPPVALPLIVTWPLPFGAKLIAPFETLTISFELTSRSPPSCGDVSSTTLPKKSVLADVAAVPRPRFVLAVLALFKSLKLFDTAKKSVLADVAAVPRPRFVLAVLALFRSLKLFAIASLVASVPVTPVSCEPSITGKPVASATITLPLPTPTVLVAASPRPRFVLAVLALFKSLKLFDTAKKSVLADVAAVPRPRFVLAVLALFRSLKLFAIASLVASVPVTPVSCEPSITGKPVASATITLPLPTPTVLVAASPRPRFVLAVPALFRSLKLLAFCSDVSLVLSITSNIEEVTGSAAF